MIDREMLACFILSMIFSMGCTEPPTEDSTDNSNGMIAMFEGRQINLAESWDDATACLGWTENGITECYRTAEQLEQRESELSDLLVAANGSDDKPLNAGQKYGASNLFQDKNFNEANPRRKMLHLFDRGCQKLRRWGMDKQVSSVLNLAETAATIWDHANCASNVSIGFRFQPGDLSLNLADIHRVGGGTWNDTALSHSRR